MIAEVVESNRLIGDRIIIPESFLEYDTDDNSLVSTNQTYCITLHKSENDEKLIICGVLEYSANPGTIIVSSDVFMNMHCEMHSKVTVESIVLPKAISMILTAKEIIKNSTNLERLLFNRLTERYCCAYKGEEFFLEWEGNVLGFIVEEIQPLWACSLIDADVEIVWNYKCEVGSFDDNKKDILLSDDCCCFETDCVGGDTLKGIVYSEHYDVLQINGNNICCFVLFGYTPEDYEYDEGRPISVHFNKSAIFCDKLMNFMISKKSTDFLILNKINTKLKLNLSNNSINNSIESNHFDDEVICESCGKSIHKSSYKMHITYCSRYMKRCDICGILVNCKELSLHSHCPLCNYITTEDKMPFHTEFFHDMIRCQCGMDFTFAELSNHCNNNCEKRQISCRFCGERHIFDNSDKASRVIGFVQDPVDRFEGLSIHESVCSNKTVTCKLCSEYVMCRYLQSHYTYNHHMSVNEERSNCCDICGFRQSVISDFCLRCHSSFDSSKSLQPLICSNLMCGSQFLLDSNNDYGLCPFCYTHIVSSSGTQIKAIFSSIMNKYLKQYLYGCGKSCSNPFCKSCSNTDNVTIPSALSGISFHVNEKDMNKTSSAILSLATKSATSRIFCICKNILDC